MLVQGRALCPGAIRDQPSAPARGGAPQRPPAPMVSRLGSEPLGAACRDQDRMGHADSVPAARSSYRTLDTHEKAFQRIKSGQKVLARIRCRLACTIFSISAMLAVASSLIYRHWSAMADSGHICESSGKPLVEGFVLSVLIGGRVCLMGLAPLADDLCLTRAVIVLDIAAWLLGTANDIEHALSSRLVVEHSWAVQCRLVGEMIEQWTAIALLVRALTCRTASCMQRCMWEAILAWAAIGTSLHVALFFILGVHCAALQFDELAFLPGFLCSLGFVARPDCRERAQNALNRLFERRSAQRAASGVAALVGMCPATEVYAEAVQRFRCLPVCQLEEGHLADNMPNPELFTHTVPARLGQCDMFVSHSWHDDAGAKWQAVRRFQDEFCAQAGREPTIWIDKFCIDQNNIERDLRCLPLFLSGCGGMVVFCGPTYLRRLWCVLELLTFVHMGGAVKQIRIEPVLRSGREDADRAEIRRCVEAFDAAQCDCSVAQDKERMLSIIRAAFGGMGQFNEAVRAIFRNVEFDSRAGGVAGASSGIGADARGALGHSPAFSRSSSGQCHSGASDDSTESDSTEPP